MRSQNQDLKLGSIDGKYKQHVKDRGGEVESATTNARNDLSWIWYGVTECPVMDLPDGGKFCPPDRDVMDVPAMAMYGSI